MENLDKHPSTHSETNIIEESDAVTNVCPANARWLVDGMAAMRSVKPRETYKEWFTALLRFSKPPVESCALSVEMINDTYRKESVKGGTRLNRGNVSKRTYIQGYDQQMLQGNTWNSFFHNIDNKRDLIKLASKFYQSPEGRQMLSLPLTFTDGDRTLEITRFRSIERFQCNQEEADTRLILHASLQDTNVVVVAKDTDILLLLVHAYNKLKPSNKWFMKIDRERYVDIFKVAEYLGCEIASYLPQIHAITGCDTTSFFFGVGKIKVLKKLKKQQNSLHLLRSVGQTDTLSDQDIIDATKFVQTVLYSGKESETLVETRIRLYKAMKTKSSQSIPPDPDSLRQALLRVHYQVYNWLRFDTKMVVYLNFEHFGWKNDAQVEIVTPVWFTGSSCTISFLKKMFVFSLLCFSDFNRIVMDHFHLQEANCPRQKIKQKKQKADPQLEKGIDAEKKRWKWRLTAKQF